MPPCVRLSEMSPRLCRSTEVSDSVKRYSHSRVTPSLDYSLDFSTGVNTLSPPACPPTLPISLATTPFSARPQASSFVVVCPAPHTHNIYRLLCVHGAVPGGQKMVVGLVWCGGGQAGRWGICFLFIWIEQERSD